MFLNLSDIQTNKTTRKEICGNRKSAIITIMTDVIHTVYYGMYCGTCVVL